MSDSDDSLDLKSDKFDPLKALYSTGVNIPSPSATTYPTIETYSEAVRSGHIMKPKSHQQKNEPLPSSSQITRRFLPHQMPISRPLPQRCSRNVLTRMANDLTSGPLSTLATCVERHLRIKVYTRHMSGVRGYVEAFVVAFDKHWNMALEDVREVWMRRQRLRVPALGAAAAAGAQFRKGGSRLAHAKRGAVPPRVMREALTGGRERCERHVGQLLMRGEHVVLVSILDMGSSDLPATASKATARPTTTDESQPIRGAPESQLSASASTASSESTAATPVAGPSFKSALGLADAVAAAVAAAMRSRSDDDDD